MATTKTMIDLLAGKCFIIPDYQRGYSWGKKQLEDLWQDLEDISIKEDHTYVNHYTGMVCLEKNLSFDPELCPTNTTAYNVIDGQQRLTTIMILLSQLLHSVEKIGRDRTADLTRDLLYQEIDGVKYMKFFYAPENHNADYLKSIITNQNEIDTYKDEINVYRHNLDFARTFFQEKINGIKAQDNAEDSIKSIYAKLTKALQFDERIVEDDMDVQIMFETMNNRGKPLSILEKLKNRLILLSKKRETRRKINNIWSNIYKNLGQYNNVLDEDRMLADHLSVYRQAQYSIFSEKVAEEKIFQVFSRHSEKFSLKHWEDSDIKEPAITEEKILDYIQGLDRFAYYWCSLFGSSEESIMRSLYLSNTSEIRILLTTMLMSQEIFQDTCIDNALDRLLVILFRNVTPGANAMDMSVCITKARSLYSAIYNNDQTINSTKNQYTLNSLYDELCSILQGGEFYPQNFIGQFSYMLSLQRGNKGFHRWGYLKYLLISYEKEYLEKEFPKETTKIGWEMYSDYSIEHIMPQDKTNWNSTVNEYIQVIQEKDTYRSDIILTNTLGNLAAVNTAKNSSLKNEAWENKRPRYKTGTLNEIEVSMNEKWDYKTIDSRGKKILKFWFDKMELQNEYSNLSESQIGDILYMSIGYDPNAEIVEVAQ